MADETEAVDLRFIPDYDVHKILTYCSEEQRELAANLRKLVDEKFSPLSAIETRWLTDACLCRYLRARSWNLNKSFSMLSDTIEWRREYKPYAITADEVNIELDNPGKLYLGGVDKYLRPIIVMKPGKDNTGAEVKEFKVKYLVYLLERAIRTADKNHREKVVLLIDFKDNSNMTGVSQLSVAKEVLGILQNHYPERLGACFMVNPPWSFRIFWGIVSPFLDEVTRNKIKVLKKTADMLELIPEDQLEVGYGGTNQFQYDYETYKAFLEKEFPCETEEEAAAALAGTKKHKKHRKAHHGGKKHRHHTRKQSQDVADDDAEVSHEQSHTEEPTTDHDDTESQTPRDAEEETEPSKKQKKNKKHSKKRSQDIHS